ncbi:MAG: hypothetical protein ACKOZM_02305, partial [Flavobacteriales bacterium]
TYADDSTKKKINERIDSVQNKINPIKELYFGKEDQKGIQNNSHTLVNQLYDMFSCIDGFENGKNAEAAIFNCSKQVNTAIAMIEACMNNEYALLREVVAKTRFDYFKKE